MTTIELKSNFHNLIDNIDDESILSKFYDILSRANKNKEGLLWNKLSLSEQEELALIEKESSDISTLISNEDMLEKLKKWL